MNEQRLATVFSALGDPQRLRALRFIARSDPSCVGRDEAVCACHVQEHLGLSQPATSYHMKTLKDAGLVTTEKRGRWVHYRVSPEGMDVLRDFVDDLSSAAPVLAGVEG